MSDTNANRDDGLLIMPLTLDHTNEELVDLMKAMRDARRGTEFGHIVCLIDGFNKDSRELFEIPEVRALCRRLVTQGFISYLDFSTIFPGAEPRLAKAWGALEVWLCGEGRAWKQAKTFSKKQAMDLVNEFKAVLEEANEKADALVGH